MFTLEYNVTTGSLASVSKNVTDLLGFSCDEMVTRPLRKAFAARDVEAIFDCISDCREDNQSPPLKISMIHKSGQEIHLTMHARQLSTEHVLLIFQYRDEDKSEVDQETLNRILLELKLDKQKMNLMMNHVKEFMMVYDVKKRFYSWVSDSIASVLGYTASEVVDNKEMTKVLYSEDVPVALSSIGETEIRQHRVRFVHKDGHLIWFDVKGVVMHGGDVHLISVRSVQEEVIQAEKLKVERHAFRQVSDILCYIAHEYRNFSLGMRVAFDGLSDPATQSAETTKHVEQISTTHEHLLRLFNDVLDVQTIQRGAFKYTKIPIDWSKLLEEVDLYMQTLSKSFLLKGISVTAETKLTPEQIPPEFQSGCIGSPTHLYQSIINLVSNAFKHSPNHGICRVEILFGTLGENLNVDIRVSDTGPGIPMSKRASLFQPYQRIEAESHTGSTGLGLYICKQHIEAGGGKAF